MQCECLAGDIISGTSNSGALRPALFQAKFSVSTVAYLALKVYNTQTAVVARHATRSSPNHNHHNHEWKVVKGLSVNVWQAVPFQVLFASAIRRAPFEAVPRVREIWQHHHFRLRLVLLHAALSGLRCLTLDTQALTFISFGSLLPCV